MKKILLLVAICATAFVQQSFAQNTSTPKPSELLTSYYNIKDAWLVALFFLNFKFFRYE